MARFGQTLFITIVSIELGLVLLAAPAATAGAVCLDKARGTLDHMLATDLSNAEIVLGKLGVRLIPVLGLIACLLPLTALASLLGGIDPLALFGSFVTSVACAVLGCSLAMALSVWGRKTHEVLMLTYLILVVWLSAPLLVMLIAFALGVPRPAAIPPELVDWATASNPFILVYEPYTSPGKVGVMTFLVFLAVCLLVSGFLMGLAAFRVRAVAIKQAGQGAGSRRRRPRLGFLKRPAWLPRLPGPSLDGNPVLWREWQRFSSSSFLRVTWVLYTTMGLICIATVLAAGADKRAGARPDDHDHVGFSGGDRTASLERERLDEPGGGARSRQPRRAAVDSTVEPLDPDRQVVGCIPARAGGDLLAALPGGFLALG